MPEESLLTPPEPPTSPAPPVTPPAAPVPPVAPPAAPVGLLNPDGTFAENWLDRLTESLAEAKPTLGKFRTFEDLAKGYTSLESLMGKKANAVTIPNEKSPPEEIAAFRKAAGVPDAPDGYNLKPEKLPEGLTWDDELGKGFAEIAHKHHIPAAAMQELTARFVASEEAKIAAYAQAAGAELEAGKAELRKEFGGNFEKNIQTATRIAKTVGLDPLSPGLRDPAVVKALVRFSGMISEDKIAALGASAQPGGMTAKDIMTNPANPYHKRYQEGDSEVVGMVRDLMKQAS